MLIRLQTSEAALDELGRNIEVQLDGLQRTLVSSQEKLSGDLQRGFSDISVTLLAAQREMFETFFHAPSKTRKFATPTPSVEPHSGRPTPPREDPQEHLFKEDEASVILEPETEMHSVDDPGSLADDEMPSEVVPDIEDTFFDSRNFDGREIPNRDTKHRPPALNELAVRLLL